MYEKFGKIERIELPCNCEMRNVYGRFRKIKKIEYTIDVAVKREMGKRRTSVSENLEPRVYHRCSCEIRNAQIPVFKILERIKKIEPRFIPSM